MIVVEERLAELFMQLPSMSVTDEKPEGFKPVYHFGDGKELNKFITESQHKVYPLIYQTSYDETQFAKQGYVRTNLELVLAVQTNAELYNTERWATTYRNILVPLFNNIDTAFKQSGIIRSEYEYRVRKRPNYSETDSKEKNAFVDIIDALVVNLQVEITSACINTIIF